MASADHQVVPQATGDYSGEKLSGSGSLAAFPSPSLLLGWFPGFGILPSIDAGYLARFELEAPIGATITGVRLTLTHGSGGLGSPRYTAGLIAPDGRWEVLGGNFNAAYSQLGQLPWPERDRGASLRPAQWHDSSPAFSLWNFPDIQSPHPSTSTFSFGEGIAADVLVTGLVAKLQSWVNAYDQTLRVGSASGHLPLALCVYRQFLSLSDPSLLMTFETSAHATLEQRPVLTVSWDVPVSSSIEAGISIRPAVRAIRGRVAPAVQTEFMRLHRTPGKGRIR